MSEETFELVPEPDNTQLTTDELSDVDVRQRIIIRKKMIEHHFIYMARDLYNTFWGNTYKQWGHESFSAYLNNEVGYTMATAKRYINLWSFYVKDLAIPPEKLHGIGFLRAEKLKHYIDRNNADQWLERAKTLSPKEFAKEIKIEEHKKFKPVVQSADTASMPEKPNPLSSALPVLPTDRNPMEEPVVVNPENPQVLVEDDRIVTKTFWFYPQQKQFVDTILLDVQKETGSTKEANNLVAALQMYSSSKIERGDKHEEKPHFYMKGFELRFGGKLYWAKSEEAEEALNQFITENQELFNGATDDV